LFISPLRPLELVAALMAISFLRTLISVVPAALLAMPLFGVWVFDLGIALAAFFFCLLAMGWAVGLFCTGLLLRMGLGAEGIVWTGIFIIAPITGIYYPVSVLPAWLHPIAWSIPSTYVFEGMRSVLFEHVFRWDLLMGAIALDIVYLAAGAGSFLIFYRIARVRGLLLQQGD
jgi:ABC-2 type transport system permease protein